MCVRVERLGLEVWSLGKVSVLLFEMLHKTMDFEDILHGSLGNVAYGEEKAVSFVVFEK